MTFFFVIVGGLSLHARLLDGLDGFVLSWFLSDDTRYANGYSDEGFRKVARGMTPLEVVALIGRPIAQSWTYERDGREPLVMFFNQDGQLRHVSGQDKSEHAIPALNSDAASVLTELGRPTWIAYRYTESPTDSHYRVRSLVFKNDVVQRTVSEFWWD